MKPDLTAIHPCLVRPTGPQNIGAAVRAAKVMGLGAVRLVQPHAALDVEARKMAAGAVRELAHVRSFPSLAEAVHGVKRVFGLSARAREHRTKPVWLQDAVADALAASAHGPVLFLFGTERTGLENEELDFAHVSVRIPTSEKFKSLNVAQAVMVTAYELRRQCGAEIEEYDYELATAEDINNCIDAFVRALDRRDFFVSSKRILAIRRLHDLLGRGAPTDNEMQLLRGMLRALDEDPPVV